MPIDALVPSGTLSPDGLAYDFKTKIDELLAAQAVVGDLDATELGYLNGVVAGAASASKVVVLDAQGKIDEIDVTALSLGGVAVTATAAEINASAGTGLEAAELAVLNGVTPGTVLAGKAVVTTTDKHIDTIVISDGGLKLGAGAGTAVSATAAELNLLDNALVGTAVASKALVVGADKNVDTLAIADGGLKLGAGAGTAVTATAAQLNGATGAGLAAASTTVAGDALVIPVTHPIVLKTTAADAEALSLADGTPGQILTITLVVDGGGDGTLTPTTKTGFLTIVFADAGDTATLIFRPVVGWMILGLAGVAAPPVFTIA